jgi:hypothetical protein
MVRHFPAIPTDAEDKCSVHPQVDVNIRCHKSIAAT